MYNTYNNTYVVYFLESCFASRKLVYAFGIFAHSLISSKQSNLIDWYRYREYIWSYVCQTSVEIIILTKPNDAKKNIREWKLVGERSVNRGCFFAGAMRKSLAALISFNTYETGYLFEFFASLWYVLLSSDFFFQTHGLECWHGLRSSQAVFYRWQYSLFEYSATATDLDLAWIIIWCICFKFVVLN